MTIRIAPLSTVERVLEDVLECRAVDAAEVALALRELRNPPKQPSASVALLRAVDEALAAWEGMWMTDDQALLRLESAFVAVYAAREAVIG